jgi:hypothetical protein
VCCLQFVCLVFLANHYCDKMGNSQGSSHSQTAAHQDGRPSDEPLEAYLREKQRNDHLKNLGLKRHTSFRKSITKRLKRHSSKPPEPPSSQPPTTVADLVQEDVDGGAGGAGSNCDHEIPLKRLDGSNQDSLYSSAIASSSKVHISIKFRTHAMISTL